MVVGYHRNRLAELVFEGGQEPLLIEFVKNVTHLWSLSFVIHCRVVIYLILHIPFLHGLLSAMQLLLQDLPFSLII